MHFAGLEAIGTDAHTFARTLDYGMHRPQIDIPATLTHIVGVTDRISKLRAFAADLANFCHV